MLRKHLLQHKQCGYGLLHTILPCLSHTFEFGRGIAPDTELQQAAIATVLGALLAMNTLMYACECSAHT
jgi:hypothetical protein